MGITRVIIFDNPGFTYHIPNNRNDGTLCGNSLGMTGQFCTKEYAKQDDRDLCELCAKQLEKIDEAKELRSRIGKFQLSLGIVHESPHSLMKIFSEMVVLEAQGRWYETIEYVALCDKFEKKEEGEQIPEYEIVVSSNEGKISWKAKRLEE